MNPPPLAWDPMLLCRGLQPAKSLQGPAVKEQRRWGVSAANKHFNERPCLQQALNADKDPAAIMQRVRRRVGL